MARQSPRVLSGCSIIITDYKDMTQNMTKMILAEKDIECEAIQGNSPRALSKKASCRHTLSILMEYGWSMARVWLDSPFVRCQAAVY